MNETLIVQLITGAIGSVGFGILFHMKRKYLPLAAAGALISWMVFILGKAFWEIFFSQHCLLVLLQMCMRKFLQESVRKHLRLFLSLP